MKLNEDWFTIPGASYYSINQRTHQVWNAKKQRFISGSRPKDGYHYLCLMSDEGGPKTFYVHRIIADLFVKKSNEDQNFVNHKNLDKTDNSIENLEWVTPLENVEHYHAKVNPHTRKLTKLISVIRDKKAHRPHIAKLLSNVIREIEALQ